MLTKRAVTGLIATAMAAGAIIAGATAVTPKTYYDMQAHTTTHAVVLGSFSSRTAPSPNTYYDM
jgi:hypothetical protein